MAAAAPEILASVAEGTPWPDHLSVDVELTSGVLAVSKALKAQIGRSVLESAPDGSLRIAHGLAGYLRVGTKAIYVIPKCFESASGASVWGTTVPEYLSVCRGLSARAVGVTGTGAFSVSPKLVAWWADHYALVLAKALSRYPYLRYQEVTARQTYLRGRLNWPGQVRELSMGGYHLICQYKRYQQDNPANRLLRWAAEQFVGLARSTEARMRLRQCLDELSGVAGGIPDRVSVRSIAVPSSSAIYREPVLIAQALYDAKFPSLATGTVPATGIVVDMQSSFESFLNGIVHRVSRSRTGQLRKWTYESQSQAAFAHPVKGGGEFATKPDNTIIDTRLGIGVVIDAKYKGVTADRPGHSYERPTSNDLYQVVSACIARKWRGAIIVSPSTTPGVQGVLREWVVPVRYAGMATDIKVVHVRLDLASLESSQGLPAMVDELRAHVARLM